MAAEIVSTQRSRRHRSPARACAFGAVVAFALLRGGHADGVCIPLPSADLQALDSLAESYPERGVAEANRRLAIASPGQDPFMQAQLYAVIAEVRSAQGRSADAHAAVVEARRRLDMMPASASVQTLGDRLTLSDGSNATTRSDLLAALKSLDEVVARARPGTVERVCALAARADLRAESLELDRAAADGIEAYTTAEHQGFDAGRVAAAAALAEIYRRSGLLDEAERMIDEWISVERAHGHYAQVASALYLRGQVLLESRNYGAAHKALDASRQMAEESGDHFSAIFTDVALCPVLIGAGDLSAADRVCTEHASEFAPAGREDIATLLKAYLGRIDLERGRPAAALTKLDDVLGRHSRDVVENLEPQIYLDRARARAALGQSAGAYADVKHSLELQQSLNREQRSRSAAVLKGAADAAKLAASNRVLEERLARQRAELSNRALTQRLAVAIATGAAIASALFAYLLWTARRHERSSRRQEAILRTVSLHAPDALMLLDQQRRVRFGNRNLFGGVDPPEAGQTLDRAVPEEVLQPVRDALDDLFEHGRSTTFTVSVTDPSGQQRQFELRGVPVNEGGQLLGAMLRSTDVTDERRLEREVINVATRERQRISNDLHEGLGQDLAGVSMLLEGMARDIDRGGPVSRAEVRELAAHVNRMIASTRDIAYTLSPVQIARGSVSGAIARLLEEASTVLKVGISMRSDPPDITVPDDTADHLCRIAVEAVTATARHPGCRHLAVELRVEDGVLRLTVAGDGDSGASDADEARPDVGEMIAYRARLLGGSTEVEREPGGGRRTTVTVPFNHRS